MKKYPDWVEKYHTPGTTIKQIGDNYYLYSSTSKYDKNKSYPVSVQRYIGKITKDNGLVKASTISFMPSKDKLCLLKDCLDISMFTLKQQEVIALLPLLVINGVYYTGAIPSKIEKILTKHYDYKEGAIYDNYNNLSKEELIALITKQNKLLDDTNKELRDTNKELASKNKELARNKKELSANLQSCG